VKKCKDRGTRDDEEGGREVGDREEGRKDRRVESKENPEMRIHGDLECSCYARTHIRTHEHTRTRARRTHRHGDAAARGGLRRSERRFAPQHDFVVGLGHFHLVRLFGH
jgi:hypothetical protein